MVRLEEKDGKLIFHSSGSKNFGLIIGALGALTLYWGFGGSFRVANLLEPLTFIRASVTIVVASLFLNSGASSLFKKSRAEISQIAGTILVTTKFLGSVKISEYGRNDIRELTIKDPYAECEEKYGKLESSQSTLDRYYFLTLRVWNDKGPNTLTLYSSTDQEQIRQIAGKVSRALGVPLTEKQVHSKRVSENEVIFKNDGPLVGSIFEEKCECRDLYYRFYQVISTNEETLKLVELASAIVGETGAGDRFGWMFPEIEALQALPRDPKVSFEDELDDARPKEMFGKPGEDWEDDEEEFEDELEVADFEEVKEIVITRAGSDYRDKSGRLFKRWDGIRKPYREV